MKRSDINRILRGGMAFFEKSGYVLPPFAFYQRKDWLKHRKETVEIFDLRLGWDVTSFGSGDFVHTGLLLFTLRNGQLNSERYPKPYAEKIMMVGEGQVTPCHFHWNKREDIINRGGGRLVMEVWQANRKNQLTDASFSVTVDGALKHFAPGDKLVLKPGQSVCLEPYIAHRFYGEADKGPVLVGEVSSVNDDATDNCFVDGQPRFDAIDEDEAIVYYLSSDYTTLGPKSS